MNSITVSPAAVPAANVRGAIERALERRAEREAKRINVDVDRGVVTLRGTVHSRAERRSVVGAARFTPGVREVDDRLVVQSA